MCGLAGWAGRVAAGPADLDRMRGAVRHRGPDEDAAHHVPGEVGLGFRRLSIIDLDTGSQPLFNEDRTVAVTCNGEIYNFLELRATLEARGHTFASRSDAEVIVHLYEDLGPDFLRELQGMFAIALWDAGRRRLLLARDRLGVKPLYWARAGAGIVYGSEPGALLASGVIDAEPDPVALMQFLSLQYVPAPLTGFAGMSKLHPGERLVFEDATARVERWWDYPEPAPEITDPEDAVAAVDELLRDATRSRLISDVPLGALLSGGIDSSLVVSYMAELLPRVQTFTIDFEDAGRSEGAYARQVAEQYGTEHHELVFDPHLVPAAADAVGNFGEPLADPSAVPTYGLAALTRRHVTVALSGDGGDEAFGGYWRYRRAARADRLPAAAGALARLLRPVAEGPLGRRAPGARGVLDAVAATPHNRYARLVAHMSPAQLERLCRPEFVRAAGGVRDAWDRVLALPAQPSPTRYMTLDATSYLPGAVLTKVDRASMAHALEIRSPLLDYRVHELATKLDPALKLYGSATKWVLRELARRRGIAPAVTDRSKQGFGMPVDRWLRGPLREWSEDLLTDGRLAARGYFERDEVEGMLRAHLDGRVNHGRVIWTLIVLELWHRRWIDGGDATLSG